MRGKQDEEPGACRGPRHEQTSLYVPKTERATSEARNSLAGSAGFEAPRGTRVSENSYWWEEYNHHRESCLCPRHAL